MRTLTLAILLATIPQTLLAEVVNSSPSGFVVTNTVTINAAPPDVYAAIINHVGDWWNSSHTFSHDAHNLSIEAKPMGCFCEKLPNGGGVRHLQVDYLVPGKTIILHGGLGPLLSQAVAGTMEISLTTATGPQTKTATKLVVTYKVAGYMPEGVNIIAAPADGMLREQFTRLQNYIERGNPATAE